MSANVDKLKEIMTKMFQLDQAELDFGIYRIMNQKRDEIEKFLDKDLLPQVEAAFSDFGSTTKETLVDELDKMKVEIERLGYVAEDNPKYMEKKAALAKAVDVTALENEVFSHLANFFRRYYQGGDFLSLRRYKAGVYAIPYEGEEVKLHWANADQYYIKSSENFRDYTFKLQSGKKVHFKLIEASTEQNNKKEQTGKERRFILADETPVQVDNGELHIRFEYRIADEKSKQTTLNEAAVQTVLDAAEGDWTRELSALAPTEKNPRRTILGKHLNDYTAKYTFDYFIHKDLGGFMRRELDFFIKNEVLFIDDLDADHVKSSISKVKVVKGIGLKIISFLEQLENFQKKLWLKKKFVVETGYCVTLDKVPEELYPTIITNTAQLEEWKRLYTIQEIEGDLLIPKYTDPLTIDFLKAHPFLVMDTVYFDRDFTERLLASFDNLDDATTGLLVNSDNFHAMNLLVKRYQGQVKCTYIDPPYNTGGDGFFYKDNYRHSSWLTMMEDRLAFACDMLHQKGIFFASIDGNERSSLEYALDKVFGHQNRVEELIWIQNSTKNQSPTYSNNHEYVEVYAADMDLVKQDPLMFREVKPGYAEIMELIESIHAEYPPILFIEKAIKDLYKNHKKEIESLLKESPGLNANDIDTWKGLYNYSGAEYRDFEGRYVSEEEAEKRKAKIWVWREGDPSMPQVKADSQKASFKDPDDPTFRFYKPSHPILGTICPHPKTGWRWPFLPHGNQNNSFSELEADHRIVWGSDEKKIPQIKRFLHEVETNVAKSVINDYADGEKELTNIFGESRSFSNPKPTTLISRLVKHVAALDCLVFDFFSGSGTTGHAVINQNRQDEGHRKYILIEMGAHFDTVLKPRIQKVIYSKDWKDGKPVSREGSSHLFKYIRLESYEDALNNLHLKSTDAQQSLLTHHDKLREDYMLSYMLDVESHGSASLLNTDAFKDPFGYQMKIARGNETKDTTIDLMETFNYLLGIKVLRISAPERRTAEFERDGEGRLRITGKPRSCNAGEGWLFREVEGATLGGEKVLIIWRTLTGNAEEDNLMLENYFSKRNYSTLDFEFNRIYVNGDNNLENLKIGEEQWKVALIEEEFKRLMFDVEGI